jgi:hypothetical protein
MRPRHGRGTTSHKVAGRASRRRNKETFFEGSQNPETASSLGLPAKDRRLLQRSRSARSRSARKAPSSVGKAAY